jgi:hypothetical protein
MLNRNNLTWAVLAVGATLAMLAQPVAAQSGAIRVESNQVLVPAVVFDKKLYTLTDNKHQKHPLSELLAHDPHLWDTIAVRDLTAKDFHIFEDGQEQTILKTTFESPTASIVADNQGRHPETIGSGGGEWTYPDLSTSDHSRYLPWPQYVIAYVPSASPIGSCHQIKVTVGRSNFIVWARTEYCNTPHPASDPLLGTDFGQQMEHDLASQAAGKIDLAVQTLALYTDPRSARVNIQLTFPWNTLKYDFKDGALRASIGTLGIISDKNGTTVARFSDFACCEYGNEAKPSSSAAPGKSVLAQASTMIPSRYDNQIEMPSGEYSLQVILSDGEKFGVARVPLIVQDYAEKQLAVDAIALCARVRKVSADSSEVPAGLPGSYIPLISKNVEFTPAASAQFNNAEMLYPYFQIYAPQLAASPPAGLKAHLMIVDAATGNVVQDFQEVNVAPYAHPGSSFVTVTRGIDLRNLSEGSYRFEIQATDSTGKITPWQKVDFSVANGLLAPLERLSPSCVIEMRC